MDLHSDQPCCGAGRWILIHHDAHDLTSQCEKGAPPFLVVLPRPVQCAVNVALIALQREGGLRNFQTAIVDAAVYGC